MQYNVIKTKSFNFLFQSLDNNTKQWIYKIISQLEINPFVGKPLGFNWFREKKFEGKRLYYLIYSNQNTVLLVAFGKKKNQTQIITQILRHKERYKALIKN
ncbi:MAG: hypothetical protein HOE11_04025 [Candidatus Diapherotrites archaeon]|jgi:mRNA-degrading endonuclease RelE of RelBE toxin-antitoxin system|nr:hypothetical protein [Candidatus Diapherotrites archaeon]MBT4596435.1 hypothetical protein [Candidatus Diapherotrites archaeon]